ncbi:MAG: type III polyketide synthase [Cyclobacteriaceae bacterium]|nr:type III polyketide synthase [Cyclobacteriaceae bacterium]
MSSFINAIGIAIPPFSILQKDAAEFMMRFLNIEGSEKRLIKAIYKMSGIEKRHSVIPDFSLTPESFTFFPKNENLFPFPGTDDRMKVYSTEAVNLARSAIENCISNAGNSISYTDITHFITVSCTGLFAPGPDIVLVEQLGMSRSVQRIAINFMGCYAAFNALKTADAICRAYEDAKVLIVCVETCTLHLQNSKEEDHLISGALFGDGAAALIVESSPAHHKPSLEIKYMYCDLFFDGKSEMAWQVGNHGFEMTLSSYIPNLIQMGIGNLTSKLLDAAKLQISDIDFFAIHPGGKRILESIEKALGLSKDDNRFSYDILKNYGNMSSATVVFVLQAILEQLDKEDDGKNILSFAFGPGLTLESMLLGTHIR